MKSMLKFKRSHHHHHGNGGVGGSGSNTEMHPVVEIVRNHLYFSVASPMFCKKLTTITSDAVYYCIDKDLVYRNYAVDFGPLNLGCTYKYCSHLNKLLAMYKGIKKVIHVTSNLPDHKVNSCLLISAYAIIYLHMSPNDVYAKIKHLEPFQSYVDALPPSNFTSAIDLIDCIWAIRHAKHFNMFNFSDFNLHEYETLDNIQYANMHWIVPEKFVAFAGPNQIGLSVQFYADLFIQHNIKTVLRLNNDHAYDAIHFTKAGIKHHNLFFDDGGTPSKEIVFKFFRIAEDTDGAIAIHCKAGLGRTGTLICLYLIKHYGITAREAVAWVRICRPGSVVGYQQTWLEYNQEWLWQLGRDFRLLHFGLTTIMPNHKFGIYSKRKPSMRTKPNLKI